MSGWQPIETAPKDGTTILVLTYGKPALCHWNPYFKAWDRFLGEDAYSLPFSDDEVTHWHSIPEAPK